MNSRPRRFRLVGLAVLLVVLAAGLLLAARFADPEAWQSRGHVWTLELAPRGNWSVVAKRVDEPRNGSFPIHVGLKHAVGAEPNWVLAGFLSSSRAVESLDWTLEQARDGSFWALIERGGARPVTVAIVVRQSESYEMPWPEREFGQGAVWEYRLQNEGMPALPDPPSHEQPGARVIYR